jgi:uncharacterized protein (TIGR02611 family)
MHSLGTLVRFIWRSGKRAAVFVLGVTLLTVGLIMFVTPGPGILLVVAGLAVLATEFAWAEHLLDKAKKQAARAGQSAQKVPGVSAVTERAGRLVPRRWRRARATSVVATEATVDGVTVIAASYSSVSVTAAEEAAGAESGARASDAPVASDVAGDAGRLPDAATD